MFKVNEIMGNFSKEVAIFETEVEAEEYVYNTVTDSIADDFYDEQLEESDFESEFELRTSYFSIEDDRRELIDSNRLSEMYDNMLDECYPEIFGMSASLILYRADKIQYDCGLNDFYDSISDQYYCEEME